MLTNAYNEDSHHRNRKYEYGLQEKSQENCSLEQYYVKGKHLLSLSHSPQPTPNRFIPPWDLGIAPS